MTEFKLEFPTFSIILNEAYVTAIYSDSDMQAELVNTLQKNTDLTVFNRRDGLYERLTVEESIKFYHKWFNCQLPFAEVLVLFELHNCAKTRIKECTASEMRRVFYAKYFMMCEQEPVVFQEPIHGVDVLTINTFINMLRKLKEKDVSVLILVTNLEHAILLGDVAYKIQDKGLSEIEVEGEADKEKVESSSTTPKIADLYKIPVNVDDKVILFEPTEIDYIESQEGQAHIVINDESYTLGSTLIEIEEKLKVYGFYRCHRSYIVNLQKVREIITWSKNTYSLRIDNRVQSTIPLSRTKIQEIRELFNLK